MSLDFLILRRRPGEVIKMAEKEIRPTEGEDLKIGRYRNVDDKEVIVVEELGVVRTITPDPMDRIQALAGIVDWMIIEDQQLVGPRVADPMIRSGIQVLVPYPTVIALMEAFGIKADRL